jgi:hypothetical protein
MRAVNNNNAEVLFISMRSKAGDKNVPGFPGSAVISLAAGLFFRR